MAETNQSDQPPVPQNAARYAIGVPVILVPAVAVEVPVFRQQPASSSRQPYNFQSLDQTVPALLFKSVLPVALDRAVAEIAPQVRQNSASLATQTTKVLLFKDYANETDETRIRNAAHCMASSLAGSLAHVTCKDPLRAAIPRHMRQLIFGSDVVNEALEPTISLLTNDNVDLGCAAIEHAASISAVEAIDEEISRELALRRRP